MIKPLQLRGVHIRNAHPEADQRIDISLSFPTWQRGKIVVYISYYLYLKNPQSNLIRVSRRKLGKVLRRALRDRSIRDVVVERIYLK